MALKPFGFLYQGRPRTGTAARPRFVTKNDAFRPRRTETTRLTFSWLKIYSDV
jgi:hypothetical protein